MTRKMVQLKIKKVRLEVRIAELQAALLRQKQK